MFQSLYSKYYDEKALQKREKQLELADGAIVTSIAIEDAIMSTTPKTRYAVASIVGLPAIALKWILWALSDRLRDALLNAFLSA